MDAIWQFALTYPALLVVPAIAFVFSLVILRIKKRYVHEGILFRRGTAPEPDPGALNATENEMNSDSGIDLEIALRKFHELGLADGDLGYAYWYEVGQLLKRAASMQAQIDALSKELEQSRAKRSE
jgi:hypothetical protein